MSQSILLRGAKQVLTLRGAPGVRRGPLLSNLEVIEDGSVFIKDGKIGAVGTTRRLENWKEARGALQIPAHNCVVMPGFVDPSLQGRTSVALPGGKLRRRKLSEFSSDLIALSRSCLQHGTLSAGVKASAGRRSLSADLSVLRQMMSVGDNPMRIARIWRPNFPDLPSDEALREIISHMGRRSVVDAIELNHDPASYARYVAANCAGIPFHLNWLNGTAGELQTALNEVQPASIFCHHHLLKGECKLLAESRAVSIFKGGESLLDEQPGSSLSELVDAGGAVALSSGYDAVTEQNFNMQLVLAVAVRRLNLTIEQAIAATTINAAYAIHRGDELGSLEPGKRADVVILNINDYRELPRRLGVNHLAMAIRDGVLVINRTRWRVGAA